MSLSATRQASFAVTGVRSKPFAVSGFIVLCLLFFLMSPPTSLADGPCDACKKIESKLKQAQKNLDNLKGKSSELDTQLDTANGGIETQ